MSSLIAKTKAILQAQPRLFLPAIVASLIVTTARLLLTLQYNIARPLLLPHLVPPSVLSSTVHWMPRWIAITLLYSSGIAERWLPAVVEIAIGLWALVVTFRMMRTTTIEVRPKPNRFWGTVAVLYAMFLLSALSVMSAVVWAVFTWHPSIVTIATVAGSCELTLWLALSSLFLIRFLRANNQEEACFSYAKTFCIAWIFCIAAYMTQILIMIWQGEHYAPSTAIASSLQIYFSTALSSLFLTVMAVVFSVTAGTVQVPADQAETSNLDSIYFKLTGFCFASGSLM